MSSFNHDAMSDEELVKRYNQLKREQADRLGLNHYEQIELNEPPRQPATNPFKAIFMAFARTLGVAAGFFVLLTRMSSRR